MNAITTLHKVASETTCSIFSMTVTPTGEWKMYIYQSKIVLIGTLDQVCTKAAAEFLDNRIPLNTKQSNHSKATVHRKFKYMGKPATTAAPVKACGGYAEKLDFAKALGFPNITKAVSALTAFEFNNQFKKLKSGMI